MIAYLDTVTSSLMLVDTDVACVATWYLLPEKLGILSCPFILQIQYCKYSLRTTLPYHSCKTLHVEMDPNHALN